MKRLMLLFLVCCCPFAVCLAQTTQDNEYYKLPEPRQKKKPEEKRKSSAYFNTELGVKSGISRGSVVINPAVQSIRFIPQTAFDAMLSGSITGKRTPVGIQFELGYINKKSGWEVDYRDTLTEQIFDLHYITLPVLLKFQYGRESKKNTPYVYMIMGPEFNYLIDAKLHLHTQGQDYTAVFDENKRMNTLEAGVILGLGCSVPLNDFLSLVIEGRGGYSLTNFNKGVVLNDYKLRNIYALINAGFSVRL